MNGEVTEAKDQLTMRIITPTVRMHAYLGSKYGKRITDRRCFGVTREGDNCGMGLKCCLEIVTEARVSVYAYGRR